MASHSCSSQDFADGAGIALPASHKRVGAHEAADYMLGEAGCETIEVRVQVHVQVPCKFSSSRAKVWVTLYVY